MQYKTFTEIKEKVERELDIEVEDFIQPEEFKGYVNDGIDEAVAEILKLGLEDEYFLKWAYLPLVNGTSAYSLPTDIYSNKIRAIEYRNGSEIYPIHRMRMKDRFEIIEEILQFSSSTDNYRYIITNPDSETGVQLELYPAARETSSQNVKIWYYRNPQHWDDDDDAKCDLPEISMNFLYSYVHWRVFDKEGNPGSADKQAAMTQKKQLMIETLTNMVPDEESKIEKDLSIYWDMS